ncbi:hypothetical protein SPAB_00711 [Salmonella enterica subsp. enterica serovar Paratyphi B str. SPB7]|uniref:Uncharacterized protein n=1 Tax=Salmonella paratyphi B (strain ATCC BAA-1250 / SPB7) TaxID=1016998 RepID=A0A6C6YYQ6_SALPB|nr:hypothetical protein SPAB_00711 [Salmonella enterica subsp. enterica serovar Paratyphi B str. SPB7]
MQWLEFALQIPPARRDGFEFGDFIMVNVVSYRRFFSVHEYMRFRY